jgi:hypothetical protein
MADGHAFPAAVVLEGIMSCMSWCMFINMGTGHVGAPRCEVPMAAAVLIIRHMMAHTV